MKIIISISIAVLLLTFKASAENVKCSSIDPDLNINIASTFINPNSGGFEYLQLKVVKRSPEFAKRIFYKTLVKRKRTAEGFEYVGMPDKSEVSLKINSKDLIVSNIKADLFIKQNSPGARKFEGLSCSVEGVPYPAIEPCPKNEELKLKLFNASRSGNLNSIQELLACGADPSVKDSKGCSALLNLAYGECGKEQQTQWGYVAPRPGIYGKDLVETIDLLLSLGATVEEREPVTERTALHFFSLTGQTDIITRLLDLKADVNVQDAFGNTPLIYGAFSGSGLVVRTLNDFNPDRTVKNRDGKTAYAVAEELKYRHLLPLLEVVGQEIKIEGKMDGTCSPLELRLKSGLVTFVLKATSKMFMLSIPKLDVDLMASAEREDRVTVNLSNGIFAFTCGVHGGKEFEGSILAY